MALHKTRFLRCNRMVRRGMRSLSRQVVLYSIRGILNGMLVEWLNISRNEELLLFIIIFLELCRHRTRNLIRRLRGYPMEKAKPSRISKGFVPAES